MNLLFFRAVYALAVLIVASSITSLSAAYPRINVAPWYEVERDWPNKPDSVNWAAVSGVAVDKQDRVWMYTREVPAVQVYSQSGEYLFGWLNDEGSSAHHMKFDSEGNVWLADMGLHIVRKHKQDGTLLMHLGVRGELDTDNQHLNRPTDMDFSTNGDIFVSDGYGNARVVHYDKNGNFIKTWGTLGVEDERFSLPHAIGIDSQDRIYVADRNNVRVQVYNTDGELIDSWKNILVPWGFWITDQDEIWICGSSPMPWRMDPNYPGAPVGCPPKDQVFMKFNTAGKLQQLWSIPKGQDGKEKPGELNWVHCLALDSKGNIYAGDIIGQRLQKFVLKSN